MPVRTSTAVAVAAAAAASAVILLLGRRRRLQPRIAYINTEDADKWNDQLRIFAGALRLPPAAFQRFDAYKGEFPTRAELESGKYNGVLITGSHYSAVDPQQQHWLEGLFECIRACAALPRVRLVGCCFGCQAVAVALGGEVGSNPDGSFTFGAETIDVDAAALAGLFPPQERASVEALLSPLPPAGGAGEGGPASLRLLQSHGEQVLRMPAGSLLLGCSPTARHELFVCGRHRNALCCQAHPEFDVALLRERIEPALRDKGRMTPLELQASAAGMAAGGAEALRSEVGRELYRRWLTGRHS